MCAIYSGLMCPYKMAGVISFSGILAAKGYVAKHFYSKPDFLLIHGKDDNKVRFDSLGFTEQSLQELGCRVEKYITAESKHVIAEEAARSGVKYLTLYTFSTENWNRPADEVTALMQLLIDQIEEETFMKNNIRFRIIGEESRLPENVRDRLHKCIEHTSGNTGMCMTLALSYSSRWEITEAAKRIAAEVAAKRLDIDAIDQDCLSAHMTTSFMPDPDLLIRTGGELRLSNYLLWQCAYSELYFCDTFWPDFKEEEFYKAIYNYQQRERRFGKTSEQL